MSSNQQVVSSVNSSVTDVLKRRLKTAPRSALPIRHTLTSKLRMEKANPLLQMTVPLSTPASASLRRATYQPMPPPRRPMEELALSTVTGRLNIALTQVSGARKKKTVPATKENVQQLSTSAHTSKVAAVVSKKPIRVLGKSRASTLRSSDFPLVVQKKAAESVASVAGVVPRVSRPLKARVVASNSSSTIPRAGAAAIKAAPAKRADLRTPLTGKGGASSTPKPCIPWNSSNAHSTPCLRTPARLSTLAQTPNIVQRKDSACLKSILRRRSKSTEDLVTEEGRRTMTRASNKNMKSVAFYSPLNATSSMVNTPPPSVLRKRLEEWLQKRGKTTYSYNHLCCFGLPKANAPLISGSFPSSSAVSSVTSSANKPETPKLDETVTLDSSSSTVVLSPRDGESGPQGTSTPQGSPQLPEQEAATAGRKMELKEDPLMQPGVLMDLKQLINSGYPRDQCEHWLHLIAQSHPSMKEGYLYWECLAALEEARGDLGRAVDCLGRAIEQGADTAMVDARLDILWERFSALGSTSQEEVVAEEQGTPSRRHSSHGRLRASRAIDPKHIFKSTVIKFALQRKAIKRFSVATGVAVPAVSYVVTPVRRSCRRSRSVSMSASSSTLPTATSVGELTPLAPAQDIHFLPNAALDPCQ